MHEQPCCRMLAPLTLGGHLVRLCGLFYRFLARGAGPSNTAHLTPALRCFTSVYRVLPLPLQCVLLTVQVGRQLRDSHLNRILGLDRFNGLGFGWHGGQRLDSLLSPIAKAHPHAWSAQPFCRCEQPDWRYGAACTPLCDSGLESLAAAHRESVDSLSLEVDVRSPQSGRKGLVIEHWLRLMSIPVPA